MIGLPPLWRIPHLIWKIKYPRLKSTFDRREYSKAENNLIVNAIKYFYAQVLYINCNQNSHHNNIFEFLYISPFTAVGLYVSICNNVVYSNLRRYNEYIHNADIQLYTMLKFDFN
jgi:hypothetical protein